MASARLWKTAMKNKAKGEGMTVTSSSQPASSFETPSPTVAQTPCCSNQNTTPPETLPSSPSPATPPQGTKSGPIPELFTDFEARRGDIINAFFQHDTAEGLGDPCHCKTEGATRTTICRECWEYPSTCPSCFIKAHRRNPTHWAEVWAPDRGYFVRHDISALEGDFYANAIHLGHGGLPCQFLSRDSKKHRFTVVNNNGIHSTRLFFCQCLDSGDEVQQLLHAGLFPASFRRPEMVFTFSLFHTFRVHHLESAESAYDFIGALRHLTDGFFFEGAANPYDQFQDSLKMFSSILTEKHSGQLLGIDSFFPNRPKGDLTVHCGACIQVGVNTTDAELRITDCRLRHLAQVSITLDGNYRASHMAKNPDVKRMSMHQGRAYFPDPPKYLLFVTKTTKPVANQLGSTSQASMASAVGDATEPSGKETEKTQCAYLNAVNKQDKAKFAGCDISGILNAQCSHIFVLSSVDLDLGEKFIHGDYAILQAIKHLGLDTLDLDILEFLDLLISYDISCAFCVNALERCKENMPEFLPIFEKIRWLIPLLHIQNHKDNCTYRYSSAYTENAGHFYGEQAEQVWPYSNQFGGQGAQMSHGNRHDLFNLIFAHWNHKKEKGLPSQLYNDLQRADMLRAQKLQKFLGLCRAYAHKVSSWSEMDRSAGTWITMSNKAKEYTSVYRHNPSMLPSQKAIYDALIVQVKADPVFAKTDSAKKLPSMLNESISIRKLQAKAKCTLAAYKRHETPSLLASAESQRDQIGKAFKRLRALQAKFTPEVVEDVTSISRTLIDETPEDQPLFMPSDYQPSQQKTMNLDVVAGLERKILEGTMYDTIAKLRTSVQILSAFADNGTDTSGQDARTRQANQVIDSLLQRDILMDFYTRLRSSMLRLGLSKDDPTFRPMSLSALSRQSTTAKHALGKTYQSDGFVHNPGGINAANQRQTFRPLVNPQATSSALIVGTQSTQPLKRKNKMKEESSKKQKLRDAGAAVRPQCSSSDNQSAQGGGSADTSDPSPTPTSATTSNRDAGWIWGVISQTQGLSNADVERYLSQGASVQWFRAEAEMLRWQEEWERKLMEFVRCIRYFERLSFVWEQLGTKATQEDAPGKAGYSRKTASRYRELASQARAILFTQAGYDGKFEMDQVLAYVVKDRERLDRILEDAISKAIETGRLQRPEDPT